MPLAYEAEEALVQQAVAAFYNHEFPSIQKAAKHSAALYDRVKNRVAGLPPRSKRVPSN
jgi:hypothetical protein